MIDLFDKVQRVARQRICPYGMIAKRPEEFDWFSDKTAQPFSRACCPAQDTCSNLFSVIDRANDGAAMNQVEALCPNWLQQYSIHVKVQEILLAVDESIHAAWIVRVAP